MRLSFKYIKSFEICKPINFIFSLFSPSFALWLWLISFIVGFIVYRTNGRSSACWFTFERWHGNKAGHCWDDSRRRARKFESFSVPFESNSIHVAVGSAVVAAVAAMVRHLWALLFVMLLLLFGLLFICIAILTIKGNRFIWLLSLNWRIYYKYKEQIMNK